ncbi:MAG: hypothetical protein HYV02_00115 [Deltaproteobacteria bacterium]|nr:hypothetical protein [Deltaproteobacteria bacterium]
MRFSFQVVLIGLVCSLTANGYAAPPAWLKTGGTPPASKEVPKTSQKKTPLPRTKTAVQKPKTAAPTTARKQAIQQKKPVVKRRQAVPRRRTARRTPGTTPALLAQPKNMPTVREIPGAIVTLLREGKIAIAARRLLMEPAATKSLYLIREMQRIGEAEEGMREARKGDHRGDLNLGVAYHNLFLFLKGHDVRDKRYYRKAYGAYKKARRTAGDVHREEVDVLLASLDMAAGYRRSAERRFAKQVDSEHVGMTFRGRTYLATYYAAGGDMANLLATLTAAKGLDEGAFLRQWLEISDDFGTVRDDPQFQEFVSTL